MLQTVSCLLVTSDALLDGTCWFAMGMMGLGQFLPTYFSFPLSVFFTSALYTIYLFIYSFILHTDAVQL